MASSISSRVLADVSDRVLLITRCFDGAREALFDAWMNREALAQWRAPLGYVIVESVAEGTPGGRWRFRAKAPDGSVMGEGGMYREIVPEQRLVFTHAREGESGQPARETVITITFGDFGPGQSELVFCQGVFRSIEIRNGQREGWMEAFNRLETYLRGVSGRKIAGVA